MQSKHTWAAFVLSISCAPLGAQDLITLGQALKKPAALHQGAEVKHASVKRQTASAHLSAIYGSLDALRVSVELNGMHAHEVVVGQVLKAGNTACKLDHIDLPSRSISLSQVSREADLCPRLVHWTGEPAPAAMDPATGNRPSGQREMGMPPIPVPHLSNPSSRKP